MLSRFSWFLVGLFLIFLSLAVFYRFGLNPFLLNSLSGFFLSLFELLRFLFLLLLWLLFIVSGFILMITGVLVCWANLFDSEV